MLSASICRELAIQALRAMRGNGWLPLQRRSLSMGWWPCEQCQGRGTHESFWGCLWYLLWLRRRPPRCTRCNGDGRMRPPIGGRLRRKQ